MLANGLLRKHFEGELPSIHTNRLNALFDIVEALQHAQELTLSSLGRKISGNTSVKNKIKKTDRLLGNKHLHLELGQLYKGLSSFIFTYMSYLTDVPIIIDLCFIKDDMAVQMMSAELATKGRTLPLYREIFSEGELAGRAHKFLMQLKEMIPAGKEVVCIMDAGFTMEWFNAIELLGWNWISRIRGIKLIKVSSDSEWTSIKNFIPNVSQKTVAYDKAFLTETHKHPCRIITTRKTLKGRKRIVSRGKICSKKASGAYSKSAKDPWILATNLPKNYNSVKIIKFYEKRMQIEQSFRDIKSVQFGLAGRNVRTKNVHRWAVKMLLAAIVQITFWILGVIGHSQGMQKYFQSNTVKDRKIFSYFTLGRFLIEYDQLDKIEYTDDKLLEIMQKELSRNW